MDRVTKVSELVCLPELICHLVVVADLQTPQEPVIHLLALCAQQRHHLERPLHLESLRLGHTHYLQLVRQ